MKVYVIQSKNGTIMNVGVSVKNYKIWVLSKRVICGTIVPVIVSVIKHVKLMNVWVLTIVLAKNDYLVNWY